MLSEQLEQQQNHRNGDHREGCLWGGGEGRMGEGTGNKKHNWQVQNRQGEVKNIGNGEARELICMTHGHELRGGMLVEGGVCRVEGSKGEKKWDSCNSTINKIYFKNNYQIIRKLVKSIDNCNKNNFTFV